MVWDPITMEATPRTAHCGFKVNSHRGETLAVDTMMMEGGFAKCRAP